MVDDRLRDGRRIAQLLASELTGTGDALARLTVTDADPDAEPTTDGALAYRVRESDERTGASARESDEHTDASARDVAEVYVQPDRARVEFRLAPDVAADAATDRGLRVRPKAVRPPRTLVFVEDGAQVKWILPVFEAVLAARTEENPTPDRRDDDEVGDD